MLPPPPRPSVNLPPLPSPALDVMGVVDCCPPLPLPPCAPHVVWRAAHSPQVEDLLREAAMLSACLERGVRHTLLERLMPKRFKQYQKGISGKA